MADSGFILTPHRAEGHELLASTASPITERGGYGGNGFQGLSIFCKLVLVDGPELG